MIGLKPEVGADRLGKGRRYEERWKKQKTPEQFSDVQNRRKELAQSLVAARRAAEAPPARVDRRAPDTGVRLRFSTTAAPLDWSPSARAEPVTCAILDAIEDGLDRVLLGWPNPPAGAFASIAIALKSARASGRLAHASLAFWPWRSGATFSSRQILVNPGDLAQCARKTATWLGQDCAWADKRLAHMSMAMIDLRVGDLLAAHTPDPRRVVVRSPTLLESTIVFAPQPIGAETAFEPDTKQILRRVREHTLMREDNAGLEEHLEAVGDPMRTPYAVFGIPTAKKADALSPYFQHPRFGGFGLDALVIDLTRIGRTDVGDDWQKPFERLSEAASHTPGRRPPVIILADDVYTWPKACRALRSFGSAQRPPWKRAGEIGAMLLDPGPIGRAPEIGSTLPQLQVDADIKDASLAPIRRDLVRLGRELKEAGHQIPAEGVSHALGLLRRAASLPLGLKEGSEILDVLYEGEDDVHIRARSLLRPKMALAGLAAVPDAAPLWAEPARRLLNLIEQKLASWEEETPVSLKLAKLLEQRDWDSDATLIAIQDRRILDMYLSADRALAAQCRIVSHGAAGEAFADGPYDNLIVIGPSPEIIRTILIHEHTPPRVVLLGDTAGSALIAAQLKPLARIAAFGPLAARVDALTTALERGGGDESLDLSEAQFRISATAVESSIDFTQAGEAYEGDVVEVRSTRVERISYRPTSDVLVYSPGETRPFDRASARDIKRGDHILVLDAKLRESLRAALAVSKKALEQLAVYHEHMNRIHDAAPGASLTEKAKGLLAKMQALDAQVGAHEIPNIRRWLTAGRAEAAADGARQPRAARDRPRFEVFMRAAGVDGALIDIYWRGAIAPSRAYRSQEGYLFNQRVVQFVLDPEGAVGAGWGKLASLWQMVTDAVDEVIDVNTVRRSRHG